MKRKILIVVIVICIIGCMGVSLAYMFKELSPKTASFEKAMITCSTNVLSDNHQINSISVTNTGNTKAFVRIHLSVHMENNDNQIVGAFTSMPYITYDTNNWIKDGDTYYYRYALNPGDTTHAFLQTAIVLSGTSFNNAPAHQTLDILAEAVQAEPANAIEETWGKTATDNQIN